MSFHASSDFLYQQNTTLYTIESFIPTSLQNIKNDFQLKCVLLLLLRLYEKR